MKRMILICLLIGLVSGACAHKKIKMTEDEKAYLLKVLELLHEFETSASFGALDSLKEEDAVEQHALPWNKWADEHKDQRSDLLHLLKGLKDMSVRPAEGAPNACELVARCRTEETGEGSIGVSFNIFDSDRHSDKDGNCIGFRSKVFCGLETDVQLHLTDKSGRPVYLTEEDMWLRKGWKQMGEEDSEAWFSVVLPLSAPWQDVTGGHLDVKFFPPQEYDRVMRERKRCTGYGGRSAKQFAVPEWLFKVGGDEAKAGFRTAEQEKGIFRLRSEISAL